MEKQHSAVVQDGASTTDSSAEGIFKGKTVNAINEQRLFGVVVELVGTGRSYVTSPTGYFKMVDIPEGDYVARFTFPGFTPVEEPISIEAGETLDLTVEFQPVDSGL